MRRLPRILDLYCGAGGAAMGWHQAGYEVVGVDIEDQPHYPFRFIKLDATTLKPEHIVGKFDAVHASPPCQANSNISRVTHSQGNHTDLIPVTRDLLRETGLPYVIENVPGAMMIDPVQLCGSSFGLRTQRHRLFECSFAVASVPCEHEWQDRHRPYERYASKDRGHRLRTGTVSIYGGKQMALENELLVASVAMGIDWMTKVELNQAIPPAFTRYIARFLKPLIAPR